MQRRLTRTLLLFGGCLLIGLNSVQAQASADKMRAVFLYSFAKYVEWNHQGGITLGVYGEDAVLKTLENNLTNKTVNGGKVKIRKITSPTEAQSCHLVYLPASNSKKLTSLLNMSGTNGVLIVSEEDLARQGANISFVQQGAKLGFVINKRRMEQSGLKISSALYTLGKTI